MKRNVIMVLSFVGIFAFLGILSAMPRNNNNTERAAKSGSQVLQNQNKAPIEKADKVEVFLFHATKRCTSCVTIGKLAGETVNEFFQPELRDGKIEFREINIDLPENQALAEKFQASGTALYINAIYKGQDNINEDTRLYRLWQDEAQFKSYLKNELDNLLGKSR